MNQSWLRILPSFIRARIEDRYNLQKIIGSITWLTGDRILRMGVGLLVGVWVARYLGPEQFGLLSYALAFVSFFNMLATLGFNDIVVRNIVREPSISSRILGTVFRLKLVTGIIAFLLAIGTIFLMRPNDILMHWLVAIIALGMIFQVFDTIDLWFQAIVQAKPVVYARNLAFILISLIKVILILNSAPLIAFAWAGLAEIVIGAAGLVIVYQANGYSLKVWRWDLAKAKSLLSDSWPYIFSGLMIMVYMRIDQIMLGEMVDNTELGIYSVAVRLVEVWYFIPTAIFASVLPSIVEAKVISDELFYDRLQKLYNLMALLAYMVAIPTTFLAKPIVSILFGEAYAQAGPMLALLIWSILFTNLGMARSTFLTTMNWTKTHLLTVFFGAVINVGLNYFLIPRYGGMGAVIASCVAYWFAAHGSCFFYKPLHKTGGMLTKAIIYPKVW
jgi:O-antigen/teichoic acid export membrane protein